MLQTAGTHYTVCISSPSFHPHLSSPAPLLPCPSFPHPSCSLEEGSSSFRRVVAEGVLEPESSVLLLSPRPVPSDLPAQLRRLQHLSSGRQLVVPLRRADGSRILVLTGWVPADVALPAAHVLRRAGPSGSPASARITGVLRASEDPGMFAGLHSASGKKKEETEEQQL